MSDYYDEIILDMDDKIHWRPREEKSFLKDHPDINTFIIINENPEKTIDYINCSYDSIIKKFDNIFTADSIYEYNNILHIYGTVGYSADTKDLEFIYDKIGNNIYVNNTYRLLDCDFEYNLFKNTFEICYDKYWKIENETLNEIIIEEQYEKNDDDAIPYMRYPRTKDGLTIPRIIYNVFKIFSNPEAIKPKIIIPNNFNIYSKKI